MMLVAFYFAWLREYQMNWGATAEDVNRYMSGDELLENPEFNATRAVEINATPEQIWPWIVQMGYSKAGFYGFDKLDNGGNPSAEHIIPEYQNLKVGDYIASGEYKGNKDNNKSPVIAPGSVKDIACQPGAECACDSDARFYKPVY